MGKFQSLRFFRKQISELNARLEDRRQALSELGQEVEAGEGVRPPPQQERVRLIAGLGQTRTKIANQFDELVAEAAQLRGKAPPPAA